MRRLIIPQSGALLLEDNFNGADNDTLEGRTPDTVNVQGAQWEKVNNLDLTIISNNLETEGFTDDDNDYKENDHLIEVGTNNVTIESIMDCNKSGSEIVFQSLIIRGIDAQNHYAVQLNYIGNIISAVVLKETVNDIAAEKGGGYAPSPAHDGSAVTLKAVDDGSNITVYYNGESVFSFATTIFNNSTKVGIKGNDFNDQIWQNFKVWKS
jgi:hypothetical protein